MKDYIAEHCCDDCAFRKSVYDNYEDISEYECLYDYEVGSDECNGIYKDSEEI